VSDERVELENCIDWSLTDNGRMDRGTWLPPDGVLHLLPRDDTDMKLGFPK
jgi:hypothetical protein